MLWLVERATVRASKQPAPKLDAAAAGEEARGGDHRAAPATRLAPVA